MIQPPSDAQNQAQGILPPSFPADYVEGAVKPYLIGTTALGGPPLLPMIDLAFSKHAAVPPHIFGLLYDGWVPNMEEDGLSVFLQAYEDRGDNNARKKIYASATTPDLWDRFYSAKVDALFDAVFDPSNAGKPVMRIYVDHYFDMYWNLHLGVQGDDVPDYVRTFGSSFSEVLGYWFPTQENVERSYMAARETRERLSKWVDDRVQDIVDKRRDGYEGTFVHYWATNGEFGDDFRRKDIVFECFHNMLAFIQWGNTFYNIMLRISEERGDPVIKQWYERTMQDPDSTSGSAFSALDRFAMELMRVISPNGGSFSTLKLAQTILGQGHSGIIHTHAEASRSPIMWPDPDAFNPDRYLDAPTSVDNTEARLGEHGAGICPFHSVARPVKDGRNVELTNSGYGAVFAEVDEQPYPICDTAGYAPFGFGYRRCGGEYLTIGAIKLLLRRIHGAGLTIVDAKQAQPEKLPVGPRIVIDDNLTFSAQR